LEKATRKLQLRINLVDDLSDADLLITSKGYYQRKPPLITTAEAAKIPIYALKSNAVSQIEQGLAEIFRGEERTRAMTLALKEAEEAVRKVKGEGHAVELSPQNAFIRRLQHQLADKYGLYSQSSGREPRRRVSIFKGG
jgi:hypothetical protein